MPAFVGREQEWARLDALVESASAGHGRIAVVVGEAGIGKTRLAARALATCRSRGFAVLSGAGNEVERRRPFGVVADALGAHDGTDQVRREIVRLLDGAGIAAAGPRGVASVEARLVDLFTGVTQDACRRAPVVLLLDDLQWADPSSLVVLNRLARVASSYPLLLVCAFRPYPVNPPLRALLAALESHGAHRIQLGGLAVADVAELASRLLGAPPGPTLRRVLQEAGGNPFYVTELLACLMLEGGIDTGGDGLVEVSQVGLPPSLRLTVLEQLRFLPDATLEVLRAAAVAGGRFSVSDVALLTPGGVPATVAALTPAERAGVVVADGERLAFRHDLIREVVYDDMAPPVRRVMHRDLAVRLAESGAAPERVAAQVMLGADPGDLEAIRWLRRAAAAVRETAPAIAAELSLRALQLAGDATALRRQVLPELVRPLLWTGQAARAEQLCAEGLQAPESTADAALFWLGLADARLLQGRFDDAVATCDEATSCPALNESDRLHLTTVRALSGLYRGDESGAELARQVVATAPTGISKATAQEAVAQWELFTGHADRAVAAYEQVESMRSPAVLTNRLWQGSGIRVQMWHALALLDLDRIDEAADLLEEEIAAKLAVPALPHAFLAACRYHAGRFDEAAAECRAAMADAEGAGSFRPASASALAATIALRRGDLEEAERLATRAEQQRTPAEAAGDTIVRWTRMLLLEASGRPEEAAEAGAGALDSYLRAGFASYLAWHAPDLVRVALATGRRDQAEAAVRAAERAAEQLPVASRRAGALRARGLFDGDAEALLAAVSACREVPRPVDLALSLRDAAVSVAGAGEAGPARRLATEALDVLSGLGADGAERRARALLRTAGVPIGPRRKRLPATPGWASLTDTELRVVRLLADGRSNPEIGKALYLSRRTVAWHVSNTLRKLGLSSRLELAAEALRREGLR